MPVALGPNRRAVLVGMAAICVVRPGVAGDAMPVPTPYRTGLRTDADLPQMLAALRSSPGCLRVEVLRAKAGDISLWQEWWDPAAAEAFWRVRPTHCHQRLNQLEL
ncbi:MAG: hypothetical protein AAGI09_10005 [Pseudomonadota bacterium]